MTRLLRPYQQEDLIKLLNYPCAGCFNEQRTGKTPTAIAVMESRHLDKVLIVCPASMLYPWKTAWKEWANKDAIVCCGSAKKRLEIINSWEHGPLIISYGCLKTTARTEGMVEAVLKKKPQGCIADEAHKFKDHTTATALAMYRLSSVIPFRLALTGTPATNKPVDIFGILKWLRPKDYPSYWKFAEQNFYITKQYTGFKKYHLEVGGWLPTKKEIFAHTLSAFTTQRKRKDVMQWLPDKDYTDIHLPATKAQLKYLEELNTYFETEHLITQTVLDRLLRERQICVAPEIVGLKGESPKLDWVVQYIEDYPEKPLIIFSKFVSAIHILETMLEKKKIKTGVITGNVHPKTRAELVQQFQEGKLNILILQIDAGKEGLTLDRAEVEIFIDQFPPAADIQQAEDRFVSTTIDKADKPHEIIRLILDNTYDQECYNLVARRASSIDAINSYIKYLKQEVKTNGNTSN